MNFELLQSKKIGEETTLFEASANLMIYRLSRFSSLSVLLQA